MAMIVIIEARIMKRFYHSLPHFKQQSFCKNVAKIASEIRMIVRYVIECVIDNNPYFFSVELKDSLASLSHPTTLWSEFSVVLPEYVLLISVIRFIFVT